MRLHLLAIPHTVTSSDFSHCAFTGKVQKFSPMMTRLGYEVLHYGTDQATSGATEDVVVMTVEEQEALLGHRHGHDAEAFIGRDADASSPLFKQWNHTLRGLLEERVAPGDIICATFGLGAHGPAVRDLPVLAEGDRSKAAWLVETGIGYPDTFAPYRIFESEAWRHFHLGHPRRGQMGSDWEWVIPNYFVADDWPVSETKGSYVLYFGRITDTKGLLMFCEMARHRPDLDFVMCGQGDPTYYLLQAKNLRYLPPVAGLARGPLLAGALAVVLPTRYVEPFGGVAVEAQLCGTPVLTSSFGAFTETVRHDHTGYRCRTLGDYLAGLERIEGMNAALQRPTIAHEARRRYSLEAVGPMFDEAFQTIATLADRGIRSLRSNIGPVVRAIDPGPSLTEEAAHDPALAWKLAQAWERQWWLSHPQNWPMEKRKQEAYAECLRFPRLADPDPLWPELIYDFRGKRVVDMGCGPFSLLLRSRTELGVAIDPLDFGPELEAPYHAMQIQRLIVPGEKVRLEADGFHEGWLYNCLQHTHDPRAILATLGAACTTVRLFEWLDMPAHEGHPQMLTEALFEEAFPEAGWVRELWEVDSFDTADLHGRYLAAILTRRPIEPLA